jgi:chromosome segregation ATPase
LINNNKKEGIEDYKNKTEARQLIEQTKKMMEEYSLNKIKKKKMNNKSNKSMSNFGLEQNFLQNNLENDNNKSAILNNDRIDQLAGKPNSIDSLTNKLILKNKEIKILERELKEKTNQLKIAQDKIAAKNEEIKKMLEILDNERSNSLKVENSKLNKKIFNLEKNNNDMKKNYDKGIEDLKIKLNNLNKELASYQNRNKELENKNLVLRNENEELRKMLEEKHNLSLTLNEKNEIEKKTNEMNNIEINNLKMNLSNIIVVLKTLFNKESQIYDKRKLFLNKLNNLNFMQDAPMNIGDNQRLNSNRGNIYDNREGYINNNIDMNYKINNDYNDNL